MGVGDEYDVGTVDGEQLPYDLRTEGVVLPDWAAGDATFLGWLEERGETEVQSGLGYDALDIQELAAAYARQMHTNRKMSGGFGDEPMPAVDHVNTAITELGYDPVQVMSDIEEWYIREKFLATPIAGDDYLWAVEHDTLRTVTEYCLLNENADGAGDLAEAYFVWPADFEQQLETTRQDVLRDTLADTELQDVIDEFADNSSTLPKGNHGSYKTARDRYKAIRDADNTERIQQLIAPVGAGKTGSVADETLKIPKTYLHSFLRATEENTIEPQGHYHDPTW